MIKQSVRLQRRVSAVAAADALLDSLYVTCQRVVYKHGNASAHLRRTTLSARDTCAQKRGGSREAERLNVLQPVDGWLCSHTPGL